MGCFSNCFHFTGKKAKAGKDRKNRHKDKKKRVHKNKYVRFSNVNERK